MSILLIFKVLDYAVFWVVYLHVLYIILYNYFLLNQAIRLRGAIDSYNKISIFFLFFNVFQLTNVFYFQARIEFIILRFNTSRVLFFYASRVVRYSNAVYEYRLYSFLYDGHRGNSFYLFYRFFYIFFNSAAIYINN